MTLHTDAPSAGDELGLVIEPLIRRHAGDAAFYWSQHDASAHSPLIDLAQLREFDRLLGAHLDGLAIAGEPGWQIAERALERNRGAGEAFVCVWLALTSGNVPRLQKASELIARDPRRMLRGLIGALAWAEPAVSRPWLERWLDARAEPHLQVAALRAAALTRADAAGTDKTKLLATVDTAVRSDHPGVRAAACRLVATLTDPGRIRHVTEDPDLAVRAEAALAHAAHDRHAALPILWQSTTTLAAQAAALGGLARSRAEHRLARWVRRLALLVPIGETGVAQLLGQLPPRLALLFVLHHGDAAYLHWIVARMSGPDTARLAGWVWQSLTGVGLEANALALAPRALRDDEPVRLTDDLDAGLPEPDPGRIAAVGLDLRGGVPCLLGAPLNPQRARQLLHDGPQALRWHSAQHLAREIGVYVDTRAPALRQLAQLRALDATFDSQRRDA